MDPLRTFFSSLDSDGSGSIDAAELAEKLRSLGLGSDALAMISAIDADTDARISWQEFERSFAHLRSASGVLSLHEVVARWAALGAGVSFGGDLSGSSCPPPGIPLHTYALAGSTGAALSRLATAPLEKLTIMMQVSGRTGLRSMLSTARHVVRRHGLLGFWAGAGTNTVRVGFFGAAVCIGYSQSLASTPADAELDAMEPIWRAAAGALAGLGATVLTHPLDVVRTRLTAAARESTPSQAARLLMAESGLRGFFRGIAPACMSVVPFVAVQQACTSLGSALQGMGGICLGESGTSDLVGL